MKNVVPTFSLRKKTLSLMLGCLLGAPLLTLPAVGVAAPIAARATLSAQETKDMAFTWIESRYSTLFAPPLQTSQSGNGYYYRYYPSSGTYLGEKDGVVQAWLPSIGFVTLGSLSDLSQKALVEMQPKAGDPIFATAKINGIPFLEQTYRYYAIDQQGNLYGNSLASDDLVGHVAILESQKQLATPAIQGFAATSNQEPVALAAMAAFYKELWAALVAYYPQKSPAEIAREIGDLDSSLEDIYRDVKNSGLTTRDYVIFYETIDKYFVDVGIEGSLVAFLERVGITPAGLLSILQGASITWDDLLARMAANRATFTSLHQSFLVSGYSLGNYLQGYVRGGSFAVNQFAGDPAVDAAKVAVKAGELGLKVAKFAWEIIKDGRPQTSAEGAYTSVFSVKDGAFENYGYAKGGNSPYIEWEGRNIYTMRLYYAKFNLGGYYGATHSTIGGKWLPSIAFKVDEAFAAWTWNLNASAAITSAANLASIGAPEPEIQVIAKTQANGWFQSFTNSFTFYANGDKGFRKE